MLFIPGPRWPAVVGTGSMDRSASGFKKSDNGSDFLVVDKST